MYKIFLAIIFGLIFGLSLNSLYSAFAPRINNKITSVARQAQDIKETVAPVPTKILENGLPDKHLIKATFIPQAPEHNWDEPWQDACEEASMLTVDYYYKKANPTITEIRQALLDMVSYEASQGMGSDITIEEMAQVSQSYLKYQPQIIDNPTVDDLKKYIAEDIPVIAPASGKTLYKENKNFRNGGPDYHNITILGYDDNNQQFIVHDVGTRLGAYYHYSYKLLMESIHTLPANHQKSQILQGEKKVLILLQ